MRGEHYAVALALVVQGQPVVAALACPGLPSADGLVGTLFTAVRGHGSIAAPLWLDEQGKSICVSPVYATAKMRMCESVESAHSAHGASADVRKRLGITTDAVRLDSQAKYGVVARGEAEIYLRLPTRQDYREKIWDHAAGALIVEEAGGRVSDVSGAPLDFTRGRELRSNRGVVVTNGPGHDEILRVLVELGVS
jgi:3'(2'), 5'-bisphosphate nucleotidase